jgi:hypothetical protein
LTLWRQGWTLVRFIFIFYPIRLPLCNKYSDYIVTFYLYTLYYYMCCLLRRIYEMHPALSLISGCDTIDLGSFSHSSRAGVLKGDRGIGIRQLGFHTGSLKPGSSLDCGLLIVRSICIVHTPLAASFC